MICFSCHTAAISLSGTETITSQVNLVTEAGAISIYVPKNSGLYAISREEAAKAKPSFNVQQNNIDDNTTSEPVVIGVLRKIKRKGKTIQKWFTVEDARSRGICSKKRTWLLRYFKKDTVGIKSDAHYDGEGYIDQFEVVEFNGYTGKTLKRKLKRHVFAKKAHRDNLDANCVRVPSNWGAITESIASRSESSSLVESSNKPQCNPKLTNLLMLGLLKECPWQWF